MTTSTGYTIFHGFLVCFSAVVFCLVCVVNFLAATPSGVDLGIFTQSTGNVSGKHETSITPAGWTFSIWGVIYAWQAIWILYALSTLCRRGIDNLPLHVSPCLLPCFFYIFFILNNVFNIAWLLLWDRELMLAALIVLVMLTLTTFFSFTLACLALAKNMSNLEHFHFQKDIWFIRCLVLNGLLIYGTWTLVATLINLSIVLHEEDLVSYDDAGIISLSILSVLVISWIACDLAILDKHTRFVFTPYLTLGFALGGILYKQWNNDHSVIKIFIMILFAVSIVLIITKVFVSLMRQSTRSQRRETYLKI